MPENPVNLQKNCVTADVPDAEFAKSSNLMFEINVSSS